MSRAFDHSLNLVFPRFCVSSPSVSNSASCALVVGIGDGPGAQTIPKTEGDVVRFEYLADILEMGIKKILPGDAPDTTSPKSRRRD